MIKCKLRANVTKVLHMSDSVTAVGRDGVA